MVDVYGWRATGPAVRVILRSPWGIGAGEAQKVHGSSLIQVCCIYLPIVIIQHSSILSNCGNQFYGLYWWILSICVLKHLWMFYGLCWVYGLVGLVSLVGWAVWDEMAVFTCFGGWEGWAPSQLGGQCLPYHESCLPHKLTITCIFCQWNLPPTPPHKSWGGKREFIGPDDNYHQPYLEKRGEAVRMCSCYFSSFLC